MSRVYDALRRAIRTGKKSRYRLWKETGISQGHLSEFMAGKKGLSVESAERLATCLGLVFTVRRVKRRKGQ